MVTIFTLALLGGHHPPHSQVLEDLAAQTAAPGCSMGWCPTEPHISDPPRTQLDALIIDLHVHHQGGAVA